MISLNSEKVTPTIFPDKTSQVWKLPSQALTEIEKTGEAKITWEFESESEFIHVAQLMTFLSTYGSTLTKTLFMPYLPYARQDKRVSNGSTFALSTFAMLINSLEFTRVEALDAHSNIWASQINNFTDRSPRDFIQRAIDESHADLLLFPDAGAETRYCAYDYALNWVTAEKAREQSTGEIVGLTLGPAKRYGRAAKSARVRGSRVLIVDDICDGGRTFTCAARAAYSQAAQSVSLYVTHGIFSRGLAPLREAGISRIWTHKGEVK